MTKQMVDNLTYKIVGAAIEVHKFLGPGLLETVYHKCLAHEFNIRGIPFHEELEIPIQYKDYRIAAAFRCDFLVNQTVIVEIKAVENILPIHQACLLNHINLLQLPKGLMLNFHCVNLFKDGQKTYINEYYRLLAPD